MIGEDVIHAIRQRRAETAQEIAAAESRLRTLRADLTNLDGTLGLLGFKVEARAFGSPPTPSFQPASKGEMTNMILRILTRAAEPMMTLHVAQEMMRCRGMDENDRQLTTSMRKRTFSCLLKMKAKDLVEYEQVTPKLMRWRLPPPKSA